MLIASRSCRRPPSPSALKPALERLYTRYDRVESPEDPVHFVHRYSDPTDREVVAFCASALAFGRVASVLRSVERLLACMGEHPAAFVRGFDPARHAGLLRALGHRWARPRDLAALLWILRCMLESAGSIEGFFRQAADPGAEDVTGGLETFSERARAIDLRPAYGRVPRRPGVCFFFPRPSDGSACKRLNLFLRWMVRRDAIDPGGWTGVSASRLIVPLDTHVIRVGRCLGLTRYRAPGWRMAAEITASLRLLDPADPVKYDFALCHLGMQNACGFGRAHRDARCPLRGLCRPRGVSGRG